MNGLPAWLLAAVLPVAGLALARTLLAVTLCYRGRLLAPTPSAPRLVHAVLVAASERAMLVEYEACEREFIVKARVHRSRVVSVAGLLAELSRVAELLPCRERGRLYLCGVTVRTLAELERLVNRVCRQLATAQLIDPRGRAARVEGCRGGSGYYVIVDPEPKHPPLPRKGVAIVLSLTPAIRLPRCPPLEEVKLKGASPAEPP